MLFWLQFQLDAGSRTKLAFPAACWQVYDAVPGGMVTFSFLNPKMALNHATACQRLKTHHVQVCTSVL